MSKVSIEAKATYRGCIEARSTVGATVQKVNHAPTTKLLLNGRSPGEHDPALQAKQVKCSILHDVKLGKNPAGLRLPDMKPFIVKQAQAQKWTASAMHLHLEDLKKPKDERYIHKILTSDEGGVLVFTFVPFILGLLHQDEVTAFECDVTFKRVIDLNEWEMVTYLPSIER
ncbi:hypothetical protein C0992_009244, partial [Termitomyces sp. T32_za158]